MCLRCRHLSVTPTPHTCFDSLASSAQEICQRSNTRRAVSQMLHLHHCVGQLALRGGACNPGKAQQPSWKATAVANIIHKLLAAPNHCSFVHNDAIQDRLGLKVRHSFRKGYAAKPVRQSLLF